MAISAIVSAIPQPVPRARDACGDRWRVETESSIWVRVMPEDDLSL